MTAWWNDYFDEAYLRIYGHFLTPARTDREVAVVHELLEEYGVSRVLDVGCGWGRHGVELARLGYGVTGLDLSPLLLDHARRNAEAAGVRLHLLRADMRRIPLRTAFDGALSLFSSLGYFPDEGDDLRVLRGMHEAVTPGGVLLLETMHRDALARSFAERDWWQLEDDTTVWVSRDFDPVAGVSSESLRWRAPSGEEGEKSFSVRVRSATEWDDLLRRAGWTAVDWFGDWGLSPLTLESPRLIVVARAGQEPA